MSARIAIMAEVADGIRCAVCEEPIETTDPGAPIGTCGERICRTCTDTDDDEA